MRFVLVFIISSWLSLAGCNSYQKVLKSDDLKKKEETAMALYNHKEYDKAIPLFEELITYYKGNKKGEDLFYYYCYSYFGNEEYLLAAYNFKTFAKNYPTNPHAEECLFMSAKSYYYTSPRTKLEQSNTIKAINELQLFVNEYPQSKYIPEANDMIDQMRRKLEKKDYEAALLYYNMGNYKAATTAFGNLYKKYPDSPNADHINFMALRSSYLLATNSIDEKKKDRLVQAMDVYSNFASHFPQSIYFKDAQDINDDCRKMLEKIKKT